MSPKALFAFALATSGLLGACSGPDFVDRLTFVNTSEYSAHVSVTDGQRDGWLDLTVAQPESETTIERVLDQGQAWIFHFDYAGKYEEEVRISRRDLERSEWRVEVPESFGAALRSMGIPPSPP